MTDAVGRRGRIRRCCIALAAVFGGVVPGPVHAGGTPATNGAATGVQKLLTPAGAATTLANGEYVTNTAGLNSSYRFWIEVPPGTPRLRVELFDPDTAALNDTGTSAFQYVLLDPSGTQRASILSSAADPAASTNAWYTFFDTSAVHVLDRFSTVSYSNDDGPLPWAAAWAEENGDASPATGRITITGGTLRINPRNVTNLAIARGADLSGLSSATLSFTTTGVGLDGDERLAVEYSTNGGGSYTTLESFYPGNTTVARSYAVTPSANARVRFRRNSANWANNDTEYVNVDDVRIQGPASAPAAGHWEVRMLGTSGDGANGVGLRANDGDAGAGGVELNVYYRSYFNYGTTSGARTFTDYPWVTSGCSFTSVDFDGDANGSVTYSSRTGAFTSPTISVSGNDAWNAASVTGWTTPSDATDYGLFTTTFVVPNDLNCITAYVAGSGAAAPPPTAQPEAETIRVYLPTDAGGKPAKPYAEQQVRHVTGAGPNPAAPGQTSRYTVTVRVVNPTPWPIVFSNAAGNVVTARVPGAGTVYGGNAQASQGSLVAQPALGGTGNVTWDPGTLAAGATALLAWEVLVTPAAPGTVAVTGTPASNGTTARYLDETANSAQSAQTRVTLGPLCQLSLSTDTPTLALLDGARTGTGAPGVVVEWTTASEAGTAGFEVWRRTAGGAELVGDGPLEPSLGPAGGRYVLHDAGARPGERAEYEIVEIEASGARRTAGLVAYEPDAPAEVPPAPESGFEAVPRRAAAPPPLEHATAAPRAARVTEEASAAAKDAPIRIETAGEGFTLVSFEQLSPLLKLPVAALRNATRKAGFSLRRSDGAETAWSATADGLLFWATPLESLFARGAVYRLSMKSGALMATRAVTPSVAAARATFTDVRRAEEDLVDAVALPLAPSADYWLWKALVAGRAGSDRDTFAVESPAAATGAGELVVGLQGASSAAFGSHRVRVTVNGTAVGEAAFSGYGRLDARFALADGTLADGANAVTIEAVRDAGTSQSIVYVDSIEVSYARRYDARGASSFVFTAGARTPVVVGGLPSGALTVWDVTRPEAPVALTGFEAGLGQLRFSTGLSGGRFAVLAAGAAARPWSVGPFGDEGLATSLRSGADYVVVTSAALADAAGELAALRRRQGLSTEVVAFEDVAASFAGGVRTPEALRAFVEHAYSTWNRRPRYLVLAGSGTYDYRDLKGHGANHVPAILRSSAGGLFPADGDFARTASGARMPIAVGRIPARTAADLLGVVAKIAAYEQTSSAPWAGRAVFLSDDPQGGADFALASQAAASRLRLPMTKDDLRLGPTPAATVRATLLERFAEGFGLLSYFGHAGLDRLAAEQLLTASDVAGLPATDGTPIVVALTCVLNRFGIPGFTALGETLTTRAGAGASAVLSSSALSDHGTAVSYAQRLLGAISPTEETRLGDAMLAAAAAPGDDASATLDFYNLLGDPALLVRQPVHGPGGSPGAGKDR